MARIRSQNLSRNSFKNTTTKNRCEEKHPTVFRSFITPRANQGIWYITKDDSVSVGLLGPTILKALSEIAAETGRF